MLAAWAIVFAAAGASGATPLATTFNDFKLPGTQPLSLTDGLATPDVCAACHSGFGQPNVEPVRAWSGSMMAQAGRDPLMWAALAIANQDAPESGETCLRCHLPKGWLEGRSVPADGTAMTADDRHGVQCSVCHRMVDPFADPENPPQDTAILASLTEPVTTLGGAQMVVDPEDRLRGPFDVVADLGSDPHAPQRSTLVSPFHRDSALCGTCHNLRNPVFTKNDATGEFELNAMDAPGDPAKGFPEQSTYDEWLASEYAATGVYAPRFGGGHHEDEGVVSSCQDCHMPHVHGKDAAFGLEREDVPLHTFLGGNTFIPKILPHHPAFGAEVDADRLAETVERTTDMLRKAATVSAELNGGNLLVRVTNETGHKLPTGYPEGRRMWLHVRAYDAQRRVVFESGRYVFETATLLGYEALPSDPDYDPYLHVWETVHGMSPDVALQVGLPPGPSSHLVLNNVREFDNRIPPRGFTNAAYEAIDAEPVGQAYADGQYWDDVVYPVGAEAVQAEVTLYYQTASREYIGFLRDENVTNAAGPILFDLWDQHDKSTPVAMAHAFVETDASRINVCKKTVAKHLAHYAKRHLKEWGRCFDAKARALPCDISSRDAAVGDALAKLEDAIGGPRDRRCAALNMTPITLGHGSVCPVPCATVTLFDMSDVAECAACVAGHLSAEALSSVYGVEPPQLPATAPSGDAGKCQRVAAKAVPAFARAVTTALLRCEAANAEGKNVPPADCGADPDGRIARAQQKLAKKLGRCRDFSGLAGCLTLGNAAAAQSCIEAALDEVVTGVSAVGYPQ